ncbi:hypothetical protein J2X34_000930 [Rhodococcus sp. BE178]
MIDSLVDAVHPVKVCCRLLGVSSPGYYMYKTRPMSATRMRRQWLTGLIKEVHDASRQTYGSRRVHAELTRGMGIVVIVGAWCTPMHLLGTHHVGSPAGSLRGADSANRADAQRRAC